jgi:Low temperature viability protein
LAWEEEGKYHVEAMQIVPDSLRGFQSDMDPDLREVLEALEDDLRQSQKSSDDEDPEDLFANLSKAE